MPKSVVELSNVPGTKAAMGWAEGHTVVIDRPPGLAGGMGLGFNGGQLLGLTIGGCFANDLRYVAAEAGLSVDEIRITVTVSLEGTPIRAVGAEMEVSVSMADDSDPATLIARTKEVSMALNSLTAGLPIAVSEHEPVSSPRSVTPTP